MSPPQKRPRLQDSADLSARLASITLTRDDLKQLDVLFADPRLLQPFSTSVSGCLVGIHRQATGQKNDLIAQISGLVRPKQTQHLSLPNRRIFVIDLGYFEFDDVAEQMPDQTDYEAWIADMEMQSLLLPSDEFLREKTLVLQELLSRTREDQNGGGQGRDEEDGGQDEADEPANRRGIMSSTESEPIVTRSSAAMKKVEVISVSSDTEEDGEYVSETDFESDDAEAEADQNCADLRRTHQSEAGDEAAGELPLDKLVHTEEQLNKMCLTFDQVQAMLRYPDVVECLPGCFVKCRNKTTNEIIIDEIAEISPVEIRFKHSWTPVFFGELCILNELISTEVFTKWIEDMTRWDEPLPPIMACQQHKKRALRALLARNLIKELAEQAAKRGARRKIGDFFGKDTHQIIVNPQQLVQLHQLGEAEFMRIVTGLFVRVRFSSVNCETMALEQIRTVSFDYSAYKMYGHRLTVLLHFERPAAYPVPIQHCVLGPKRVPELVEQHTRIIGTFVPPPPGFIQWKMDQLRDALSKTPRIV